MPSTAYLIVSKSPYLFLISIVTICLALILEVRSANGNERSGVIQANTIRLQILAVVVLIISFLAALSTANYDIGNAFSFFVNGRYALIYAFFLIGISLLLSPKQVLGNVKMASIPDILGLLLVVVSPVLFYAGLKIHLGFTASAIGSLIVAIIGFVLLVGGSKLFGKKPQKPATTSQVATPVSP
jgi:peptidoglycan/LPS O-acetylase OafA/YrhL